MKQISTVFLFISISITAQTNSLKPFEGIWLSEGYGRVVEIKKNKAQLYDICKVNCTKAQILPKDILLDQFKFSKLNDSLLEVSGGITKLYFNKINDLPELCSKKVKDKKDPIYNFETLWHTFNENYCYFEERKINWSNLKTKYKSQIKPSTTPFELFLVMDAMIEELNDGHSNMYVPEELEKKYRKDQVAKREIRKTKILDSLGQDYKLPPINVDSIRLKVISNYVKDVKTYNYGVLNYGFINDEIAIVQVNGMDQFANFNIPKNISKAKAMELYEKHSEKSQNYTRDNTDGTSYIMNKVLSEIKNTKACIIDVRFNGGGFDEVQLEILKRFATQDTLVVTKKARNGNGFTKKSKAYISPSSDAYKGDVYFLTSHQTASAAEDFILCAMSAVPNAIRIGSNTTGIFSDILDKKLPNGWQYGLSNEIYESPDGMSYEAIGIPPHHQVTYHKKGYWFYKEFYDNVSKKDEAIDIAMKLIQSK